MTHARDRELQIAHRLFVITQKVDYDSRYKGVEQKRMVLAYHVMLQHFTN